MNTTEINTPHTGTPKRAAQAAARAFLALAFAALASVPAFAQQGAAEQQQPGREDVGPPPMRHIPDALRRQLDEAGDLKARTRRALELLDQSLLRSAGHAAADRFDDATAELGVYEALVKEAIAAVRSSGRVTNKQRDLFKKIELALRSHVTRLETIRRSLPARNGVHVADTIEYVREHRDIALNSFYDDTVIPEQRTKETSPVGDRIKGSALTTTESEKKPDQR